MLSEDWGALIRRYRLRHGLTQGRLAAMVGVSQRTISRWERGQDAPSLTWQRHLRDLGWQPSDTLLRSLAAAIPHCPFPRALSRTQTLRLQALSRPAIEKRPSVTEWIGRDLAPIACGILEEMLDDAELQRGIANREIAGVVATTRSVLQTAEHTRIGTYRTVITYFFHEGTLYSDAISSAAEPDAALGYKIIPMDEFPTLGEPVPRPARSRSPPVR
jgi:transcriptional regulator with XRE-family HTH domain